MKYYSKGFSIIELIVTILMVGIIAKIAMSTYSTHIRKSRRNDAIDAILSISLAEARYRSSNTQYGTLAQVWSGVSTSTDGYYTLAISNVSATSYTITATAVGNQANDSADGTACTPLTFADSSGTITKSPSACWPK